MDLNVPVNFYYCIHSVCEIRLIDQILLTESVGIKLDVKRTGTFMKFQLVVCIDGGRKKYEVLEIDRAEFGMQN